MTRIRQIALVAADVDWSIDVLRTAFDAHVAYRDPAIVPAFGGMFNCLLQIGDCFLEVVSPTDGGYEQKSTSARMLERGGDGGYMVILQVDDVGRVSRKMEKQGKVVWANGMVVGADVGKGLRDVKMFPYKVGDQLPRRPGTVAGVHVQYHPRDFATLLETDEAWPADAGEKGTWIPAGNSWQHRFSRRKSTVQDGFAGATVAVPPSSGSPEAMCAKWAAGLGLPAAAGDTVLHLSGGQKIRFVAQVKGGRSGVVGVDMWAAPGLPKRFTEMELLGVRWRLVDPPASRARL